MKYKKKYKQANYGIGSKFTMIVENVFWYFIRFSEFAAFGGNLIQINMVKLVSRFSTQYWICGSSCVNEKAHSLRIQHVDNESKDRRQSPQLFKNIMPEKALILNSVRIFCPKHNSKKFVVDNHYKTGLPAGCKRRS